MHAACTHSVSIALYTACTHSVSIALYRSFFFSVLVFRPMVGFSFLTRDVLTVS